MTKYAIMSEWKEYITVENLTLVVGVVTLLVTYLSYRYMRKSDKRNARNLLDCKEAYKKEFRRLDIIDRIEELKESYDLVFEITGSGEGYIAEAKLFKELLDKNNKLIVPDLTKEFESIIKTQYYFFPQSLLK